MSRDHQVHSTRNYRHKISDLMDYLYLVRTFTLAQFKIKDQSTFFGLLWSFLHPLIMLFVLYFVFNDRIGSQIQHYSVFLIIGIVQYNYFVVATGGAMNVLSSESHLAKNAIFPKEILVASSVFANTIEFLFEMTACLGIAVFFGIKPTPMLLFISVPVLMEVLLVLWIGMFLSVFCVFIKDVNHIWQIFSKILFFLTPIFYMPAFINDPTLKKILDLNPLTILIRFSREAVLDGVMPPLSHTLLFLAANMLALYLSYKYFKCFEKRFAENL